MRISCQSFSLPKAGRSFADCEDSYFPGDLNTLQLYEINHENTDVFRASVSDGATDSIFSKLWAQLLAFGYGAGKWESDITAESVLDEQTAWLDFLAKQQLPWYAEEKAELGAFAAMVGLTLFNDSKRWTAMALGDCCIFHIRNGACIRPFPISSSAAFSNFPLLLCSVAERNSNVFDSKQVISDGTWQAGDQFVLMSDTVACWFLSQMENGNVGATIAALESAQSLDAFVSVINHARTTKGADGIVLMRDDDVTVTLVTVADDAAAPLPKKFDSKALAAAIRPTVEIPKIAVSETKNTAELPPIPVQNKSVASPTSGSGGRGSVAAASAPASPTNATSPTSPTGPMSATSAATQSAPSLYPNDATGGNGGMVREQPNSKSNYASRSRNKSNQPGIAIFIVGAIAVAAAAIGAATLFSHKSEKHPTKVERPAVSETAPALTKSDDISAKQFGNHHRSKHKLKKNHPLATVPTGSASTEQVPGVAPNAAPNATSPNTATPNTNTASTNSASSVPPNPTSPNTGAPTTGAPNTASPNPIDSNRTPLRLPAQEQVRKSGQPVPPVAPDRGALTPANRRPMSRSLDHMPPQAPERIRMPSPAPDRSSGLPVQLPDQVHQDRGLDHSSIGQSRRNKPVSADKIYPEKRKQNELPENLNSQTQVH